MKASPRLDWHGRANGPRSGLIALCIALAAAPAGAQNGQPAGPAADGGQVAPAMPAPAAAQAAPATAAPREDTWDFFGSLRTRQEVWRWFETPGFEDLYTFNGVNLRFGAARRTEDYDLLLELMGVGFINLPHNALAPPPQGPLGTGALYQAASADQDAAVFIKQAFWRGKDLGARGNSLRVGRFEFIDGMERVPRDPSLAWLKRERIAHRLIGNFGWTHVQRSFDGAEFTRATPGATLTLFGGIPTRGVFDISGMDHLPDVRVGYAAGTLPFRVGRFQGEGRLFGIYYHDARNVVKTDNRPLPVRAGEFGDISLGTVGGHAIGTLETRAGKVDGLLWTAGQFGSWGNLDHGAFSLAAEAGFQPEGVPWRPWFRAGFLHAAGDGDPRDGRNGTFIPLLTTARIYARFPFYTPANLNDAFAQVILRPTPKLTVRGDGHALWLADRNDLWYQGGGAFQDRPSFGFAGRPGGGNRGLAFLGDISLDYQWRRDTTLSVYFGYAAGGNVVRSLHPGDDGFLGYVELTQRF